MAPNGYTETLLTNLCKDPKGFCLSKKANKYITNKYCKDIDVSDVIVKQQIKQAQVQQQQQIKQAQQQVQQQQQQIKQAQQQQQQLIEVTPSSEDILNDYYLQKCNAFKANPSKNPFNKTNKGRHMVPTKYTQKLLDELCAGPPAFCNKHKGSKRISNKYCTEAPTVTQLKKEISQQIQQVQQQIKQAQQQQQVQQQIKQAQQQQLGEEEEDSAEIFIPQETQTQSVEQSVASMFEKAQWTEKCAQYAANPNKNPFNKTNRGKHFKPNNYTTHILDELCANPKAYCDKKKGNKYISNKYCNL
jgi:type II secretory pathway pseudopilin PulG